MNCLQVQYTEGPLVGLCEQIGHVKAGISRMWRVGDTFKAGEKLCECGTAADGQGIRHFHVEYFDSPRSALAYDHRQAMDPAKVRHIFGERDLYRRPSSFGGGTASSTDSLSVDEAARMDICQVAHE